MTPIGKQTITNATLATATPLEVPPGTKVAVVQAIGQNFNYWTDGSTPTTGAAGEGKRLLANDELVFAAGLTSILFIREADIADSRLVVEYFAGAL